MNNEIAFTWITMFCALVFIGIGLIALKQKTATHFFSNQKMKPQEISDVPSYNKAVGTMWLVFGSSLVICSLLQLVLKNIIGPILFVITLIVGIALMSIKYGDIYNKYK